MAEKRGRGKPKGEKTITVNMRVPVALWDKVMSTHRGKINKMFNEMLQKLV